MTDVNIMEILNDWHELKPGDTVYESRRKGIKRHEVKKITKKPNWCQVRIGVDKFLVVKRDGTIEKKDKYGNHRIETDCFFVNRFEANKKRDQIIQGLIIDKLNKVDKLRKQVYELKKEL